MIALLSRYGARDFRSPSGLLLYAFLKVRRFIGGLFYLIEFCMKPAIGKMYFKTSPSPRVVSKAPEDP